MFRNRNGTTQAQSMAISWIVASLMLGIFNASSSQAQESFRIRELSDSDVQALGAHFVSPDSGGSGADLGGLRDSNLYAGDAVSSGVSTPASGGVSATAILGGINDGLVILDKIINMGKTVWQFIQDGKAVVNLDLQGASALPAGIQNSSDLTGWEPKSKNYQIIIPDSGRDRKVEFVFRVSYLFGGSLKGKGQFMSNIMVQASDYKVNWGQKFNVRARVPNESLINVSREEGNPIAAAEVMIEWSRSKIFSASGSSAVIYVRGDGQMKNISSTDDDPEDVYPIGRGAGRSGRN